MYSDVDGFPLVPDIMSSILNRTKNRLYISLLLPGPNCLSCPAYAIQMTQATWAIWAAIKKYSHIVLTCEELIYPLTPHSHSQQQSQSVQNRQLYQMMCSFQGQVSRVNRKASLNTEKSTMQLQSTRWGRDSFKFIQARLSARPLKC